MSIETLPEVIRCNLCGHAAELHRFASPIPGCAACPDMQCALPATRPMVHVQYLFADVVSGAVERPTAEAAWQLVLDTWRVIEVASARAGVTPSAIREEWMAALRIAIFRADNGVTEPVG